MRRTTYLLLLLSLLCSPTIHATAQRQDSRVSRSKAGDRAQSSNRSPIIKSFTASSPRVVIPCPRWTGLTWLSPVQSVDLRTDASDPDGDKLLYRYPVSEGQITGTGSTATWDLTGVMPGSYEAAVIVSDQHGAEISTWIIVDVLSPLCCLRPCPSISVSCPDDVEDGQSVSFSVTISGGDPSLELSPTWSVSAGTIVKREDPYKVEVDTAGLGGQQLEITVDILGMPPECSRQASCKVQVKGRGNQ